MKRLLLNRNLTLLFCGQVVSQMGDSMYLIGVLWLVLELTGSKSAMGTVAAISYLPMLVFGIPAGIVADLIDRKKVMVAADLLRAFVVLVLPLAIFMSAVNLTIIYAVSFVLAVGATFFNPARDAIIPHLVARHQLIRANTLVQVSNYAAVLLGPLAAAAVIALVGLKHLFTLDALTFIVSLAAVWFIAAPSRHEPENAPQSLRSHFIEIIRYVHAHKKLRLLLALTTINNFFIMGPAIVGTPIFVKEILLQGASSYALVESSLGVGMIVGSVLINVLGNRFSKGRILLAGLMFDGLTYALVYLCNSLPMLMALIAFHAVGIPLIVVSRTALVQEWVESRRLGRVFSLINMAVIGTTAIASGVTGWLAESFSVATIFGFFGLGGMLCGIVGWFYRDLRES